MEITLENIGIVKNATVKLNGLTLLAGTNDSGKSTVGKSLFAILKASEKSRGDYFFSVRRRYLLNKIDEFRVVVTYVLKEDHDYEKVVKYLDDFKVRVHDILSTRRLSEDKKKEAIINQLNSFENVVNRYPKLTKFYSTFRKEVFETMSDFFREEFRKLNFQNIINSLFDRDICNKENPKSKITLTHANQISAAGIHYNKVTFFREAGKFFEDVTYVDSPVILQLIDLLSEDDVASKEYLPTAKDLKQKIIGLPKNIEDKFDSARFIEKMMRKVESIIGGEVGEKAGRIEFEKDGYIYSVKNISDGIKSFILLLLLLKKNILLKNTLLVIEEPEVFLHPNWQLKYARIIMDFVKGGITVLLNSHSPYMIEAIKSYVSLYDLEDKFDVYFTHNGIIKKVDNSNEKTFEKIFNTLAEPFSEIEKLEKEVQEKKGVKEYQENEKEDIDEEDIL